MALAPTSLQSFLTGRPLCTAPQLTRSSIRPASARLSCRASDQKDAPPSWAGNLELKNLGKLAMVAMAAGVLVLAPVDDAMAGKSGGRIGGKAFRSAAPRSSGPRINNSRTNIYVNPGVAPPLVGGYGYGGYGGYGLSPFGFYGGPSVALGVGGGFDTLVLFIVGGAVVGAVRRFLNRRDNDDYDD
ncbi:hypothetical protein CFC21_104432 [Triticum aestivum]|uniref:Uncharacterized protein n=3 Tax=Triticinae TaxID=1648030 RepID=A0A1D6CRS6_WHEAT|nr:uncharacterized protein LOC109740478 [Aegilops tauschii subsp. strangulata]XP_037465970.1 uncharacterized protein LOC119337842 [Triticum dicoccoides]XP_044434845.1 uncharacterized protein LOC123161056 [Triticum aestivum]XP_044441286.1 uncharacterized protein LOC123167511 [Triticum aestivum]KAF7103442.1 hypothetical protein CFC21_104432 [Triticum aestivum]